jgi:hypothetical protein
MSILDPQSRPQPSEAEMKAEQIVRTTADTARRIYRNWEMMYGFLWQSSDPQAVLDQIGTDAAEVFALSSAIINLMQSTLPEALPQEWERIEAKIAQIPAYTVNEDGTVTID